MDQSDASGKGVIHQTARPTDIRRAAGALSSAGTYAFALRGPCVSRVAAVYLGVTTTMAIAEPTDLAYERAFEEHWTDVFRFALAWTNDWTAAEDLAQEAYLRLWNHRGHIDWSRPVLPWLLVTTRRLATDRFRNLRRRLLAPTHAELDVLDAGAVRAFLEGSRASAVLNLAAWAGVDTAEDERASVSRR